MKCRLSRRRDVVEGTRVKSVFEAAAVAISRFQWHAMLETDCGRRELVRQGREI